MLVLSTAAVKCNCNMYKAASCEDDIREYDDAGRRLVDDAVDDSIQARHMFETFMCIVCAVKVPWNRTRQLCSKTMRHSRRGK